MIKVPPSKVLDILFPKVRAEILRLLFFEPAQERYVRELVVMSGLALRTIQEELANLSAAGLVTSWSNGYHRFYRANRRHPLFPELRRIVRTSARLPGVRKPPPRRKSALVSKKAWLATRRIRSLQTPLV
jgi:predicted transcriptional regulator